MRVLSLALLLDGCCSDDTNGATGHDTGQGFSTLQVTNGSSHDLIALVQHDFKGGDLYELIDEGDSIGVGETESFTIGAGVAWMTNFFNEQGQCGWSNPYTLEEGEEHNLALSDPDFTGSLIGELCSRFYSYY